VTLESPAVILIGLALVSYSIGVWSERFSERLRAWHLVFFWTGLVLDATGTGMMLDLAGGLTGDFHGTTGIIAFALMLVHAVWATVVIVRKDEGAIVRFHRFSVFVWLVWLVPVVVSPMTMVALVSGR
jgi:uncharacterized repeat protein (TIGR03987 family)